MKFYASVSEIIDSHEYGKYEDEDVEQDKNFLDMPSHPGPSEDYDALMITVNDGQKGDYFIQRINSWNHVRFNSADESHEFYHGYRLSESEMSKLVNIFDLPISRDKCR